MSVQECFFDKTLDSVSQADRSMTESAGMAPSSIFGRVTLWRRERGAAVRNEGGRVTFSIWQGYTLLNENYVGTYVTKYLLHL